MDVGPRLRYMHVYKIKIYTWEKLNLQDWRSHVHWGGQSSLSRWWVSLLLNLNAIFGACLLWDVVQTIKACWFLKWATSMGKKTCLLYQFLGSFRKDHIHLVLLHIKSKSNRTCTYLFLKHTRTTLPSVCVGGGGRWVDDLEQSPYKRWPLKSLRAIQGQAMMHAKFRSNPQKYSNNKA